MKNIFKTFLALNFFFLMLSKTYSQVHPQWFDERGVYRNGANNDVLFDSQIRTTGLPAWSWWFTLSWGGEKTCREKVTYQHSLGKFYVGCLEFNEIFIGDTLFFQIDSICARSLDQSYIIGSNRLNTSSSSPHWKQVLIKNYLEKTIDAGADGIFFDGMKVQYTFDKYTLTTFREYLKKKYTNIKLQSRFDIQDIDSFNYIDWIQSHGQLDNWEYLPIEGLKEEFWIFLIHTDRDLFIEVAQHIKNYARQNYQREITISCNAFFAPTSDFDTFLDLIDYSVGEFQYFGKTAGDDFYDFIALSNKVRRSIKDWPIIALIELEGIGILNYPSSTKNLIRLIFADSYASEGSVVLNPMFDGIQNDQLIFNVVAYDWEITGKYANFIYNHPTLFSNLTFKPYCGLLYSMSSLNLKNQREANGLTTTSFYGTGQFLIDHSIPFDVIFAPEARFSTYPDISLAKVQQYETVILPNTVYLNDNQIQVILDYVRNGGTIVSLGDIGIKGEDGHLVSRPEIESLQAENGVKTLELGKFVYFREERSFGTEYGSYYWANPEENNTEFYDFIKPYIHPELIISGANSVSGFIYQNSINNNTIIHLVNYHYDIPTDQFFLKENVALKILADTTKAWEAVYVSPDFLGQQILATNKDSGYISMTIPRLEAYGIIILQENQTAPQIVSRTPETNITIIGGDSLRLSVEAVDPDGNPLFFQWYINGVVDSLATDSTYLFRTRLTSSGIDTLTVEVSDGSHMISSQWLVTIQRYVFPKILFDESHNERNTISLTKAQLLNPAYPDMIYFGILKSKMDVNYATERYEAGVLLPSVLQNYNVLILSAPDDNLSSLEIDNIVSFVSNGGGLIFLGDSGLNQNINSLLQRFGIQFEHHVISEPVSQGQDRGNTIVYDFINHASLGTHPQFNLNWGGSFSVSSPAIALGFTDSTTWRDMDWDGDNDTNEPKGPFTIVAAAEYENGRIFCVSDNAFHDDYVKWAQCPNDDLFLKAVKWLTADINSVVSVQSDEPNATVPESFDLSQNYPNPFNPSTTIRFQLPKHSKVSIKIYDVLGQEVRTLLEKDYEPGYHTVTWDGSNNSGIKVASGVYLYRMETGDFVKVRKALFLK